MNNKEKIKILEKAIEFLKKGWCRNEYAKRKDGISTTIDRKDAAQWCMIGAIRATGYDEYHVLDTVTDALPKSCKTTSVVCYNDEIAKTKRGPILVFRRAINAIKAEAND